MCPPATADRAVAGQRGFGSGTDGPIACLPASRRTGIWQRPIPHRGRIGMVRKRTPRNTTPGYSSVTLQRVRIHQQQGDRQQTDSRLHSLRRKLLVSLNEHCHLRLLNDLRIALTCNRPQQTVRDLPLDAITPTVRCGRRVAFWRRCRPQFLGRLTDGRSTRATR